MAMETFIHMFETKTKRSKELWEEAKEILPGGVSGSGAYLSPYPIYVEKAIGGKCVDVDGNEYIDLFMGGFPNILGYTPECVIEAAEKQLRCGACTILFQKKGVELAQKMRQHMPHLEMIRFCNTGSEATMFAIRSARSWTKKTKIAKPEGGYHGQHDYVLISGISGRTSGPADRPQPTPDSAGIPRFIIENTVVIPWNDIENTVAIIKANVDDLAAVILEPMQGSGMGDVPADREYLEAIRQVTAENNIILIFDEIVTGYRLSGLGGAVKYYGVTPDLACYGKVIGGGFPIGAFGGRRDIMHQTLNPVGDPEYKIFQSGTFTGNPIAMTAGLACLSELENRDYAYIDGLAEKLRSGLSKIAASHGFKVQMTGISSMFYVHFNNGAVRNMRDKLRDNAEKNREFSLGMITNGVYLPPVHPAAVCFAHTDQDIARVLTVAEQVFKEMK